MLAGAVIGAAIGDASKATPAVFTGFVAFGVVALLFLVTHELLIEAHEALKVRQLYGWADKDTRLGVVYFLCASN